ncbi:MAG: desulfoferrodoxin family protein, partial [Minisyncoccales bacterium]
EETFEDEGHEKHLPVIEKVDNGTKIKIGSNPHPMIKEHYIEWIELINGDEYYRKFLSPDDKPEVVFEVEKEADIEARAYCNVHGLWALRN